MVAWPQDGLLAGPAVVVLGPLVSKFEFLLCSGIEPLWLMRLEDTTVLLVNGDHVTGCFSLLYFRFVKRLNASKS